MFSRMDREPLIAATGLPIEDSRDACSAEQQHRLVTGCLSQ